jgi:hypothetical protein
VAQLHQCCLAVLGNLLAVAGVVGLSILWEASSRSTSTSHVPTIAETEAIQLAFSKRTLERRKTPRR